MMMIIIIIFTIMIIYSPDEVEPLHGQAPFAKINHHNYRRLCGEEYALSLTSDHEDEVLESR